MAQSTDTDTLRYVESFLSARGTSLASLVIDALRDSKSSLAKDLIARISDVLEALRPALDGDSVVEIGRFFASIASSELSDLGEDGLWRLPATKLSARRLQEFSIELMSKQITAEAPGFSSFLYSIMGSSEDTAGDDEPDTTQSAADPAQLLDIVRAPAYRVFFIAHIESRRR